MRRLRDSAALHNASHSGGGPGRRHRGLRPSQRPAAGRGTHAGDGAHGDTASSPRRQLAHPADARAAPPRREHGRRDAMRLDDASAAAGLTSGRMTSNERPPIVLLHGLGRTRWSLWPVAREATRRGRTVHNLGYPSRRAPIEELADDVGRRMRELAGDGAVDVVTHSMGGIVLRAAAASGAVPPPIVHRVVMLAPPNHGSELADRLKDYRIYRFALGPAGQQ